MSVFKDMYTRVQNYIGDDSSGTKTIIKETINYKIKELLQRGMWRFALRDTTVSTTSGTEDYYLTNDVDKIVSIRQETTPVQLKRVWIGDFERLIPEVSSEGEPKYYMELLEDSVLAQPTAAGKVIMYSTSDSDVSPETGATSVTIHGVSSSVDRIENVSLSATNEVSSTNTFSKIYSISTDIVAVGTIYFRQLTVGTELLLIYPGETYRSYKKFKVYPKPNGTYTLCIRYTVQQPTLVNDADSAIIPHRYSDVIVNMAVGDMLLRQGDKKATGYITLAEQGIQRMLKEQDMLWDYVPSVRHMDVQLPFIDSSYPFSYY